MAKRKNIGWYILFTAPLLLIFITVVIIPFIIGIYYSFFEWDGIAANPKVFVGFDNFTQIIWRYTFSQICMEYDIIYILSSYFS